MSKSQEDIKIEVEEDDSMDIERPGEYSNEEDNEDPEDTENKLEEEDFLTKVKEIATDNIPHFVRNGGIAAMEISSNPYVKGVGSVCHLIGDLFSSANNDSKTREELNLLKQLTTDVKEREKRCQQREERVFQRELHVAEREKNVFEREKQVVIQMKEILEKFKTTKDKRERTDTEDENEEDPPQAKGYDGAKRIKCQCGSEIRKSDMARHFGTIKHQDYTEKM